MANRRVTIEDEHFSSSQNQLEAIFGSRECHCDRSLRSFQIREPWFLFAICAGFIVTRFLIVFAGLFIVTRLLIGFAGLFIVARFLVVFVRFFGWFEQGVDGADRCGEFAEAQRFDVRLNL